MELLVESKINRLYGMHLVKFATARVQRMLKLQYAIMKFLRPHRGKNSIKEYKIKYSTMHTINVTQGSHKSQRTRYTFR